MSMICEKLLGSPAERTFRVSSRWTVMGSTCVTLTGVAQADAMSRMPLRLIRRKPDMSYTRYSEPHTAGRSQHVRPYFAMPGGGRSRP